MYVADVIEVRNMNRECTKEFTVDKCIHTVYYKQKPVGNVETVSNCKVETVIELYILINMFS